MINNNLDYEKNSNTLTPSTTTTTKTTTTAKKASTTSNNSNTTKTNQNDNSYFNRFDNRIAANLAAVINGARFRSSSLGRSSSNTAKNDNNTQKQTATTTTARTKAQSPYNSLAALSRSRPLQQQQQHHQQQQQQHRRLSNIGVSSRPSSPSPSLNLNGFGSIGRRRPLHLFAEANLNCNDNEKVAQTPSSDEDNSPTELNNCKRLADKPPLVKRLTMGLLRSNEDSRPLVTNATPMTTTTTVTSTSAGTLAALKHEAGSNAIYSNGYVNDDSFEPEKFIDSKFGDSCRQSLTAIPMLDNLNLNDNSEFNLKKRYLRETSSANSSPKIFANRLRLNNVASRYAGSSGNAGATSTDEDEAELKDAGWYQAGISREIAIEVLSSKSPGAFLVRKSASKPGCYALTLRVPSPPGPKIVNYIILRTAHGYKIKGFRKEFSTLKALITHHSVMPEMLPVPLAMPRPTDMSSSRRNLDDFDTYDSLQMLLKYLRAKNIENE